VYDRVKQIPDVMAQKNLNEIISIKRKKPQTHGVAYRNIQNTLESVALEGDFFANFLMASSSPVAAAA
jgi:hypothetical protein